MTKTIFRESPNTPSWYCTQRTYESRPGSHLLGPRWPCGTRFPSRLGRNSGSRVSCMDDGSRKSIKSGWVRCWHLGVLIECLEHGNKDLLDFALTSIYLRYLCREPTKRQLGWESCSGSKCSLLAGWSDSDLCNRFFGDCVILWVSSQSHKNVNGDLWII